MGFLPQDGALPTAAIYGCEGVRLTDAEKRFFAQHRPFGFILFARNCESPEQVKALVEELRATVGGHDAPVLIDQEGGRVARLKPPHWRKYPPARQLADLAKTDEQRGCAAVRLGARLIAEELHALGINVDCVPLADVPVEGSHDIIGDRAYGTTPERVAKMAREASDGLLEGGVLPVLKHIPGHGRAMVDSHLDLPEVTAGLDELRATDFKPFVALADLPFGMTAHVRYTAIDPTRVATLSPACIRLIREELGFQGMLMSDDISMKALSGSLAQLSQDALAAGCDLVLHCNGKMDEMEQIASVVPPLTADALKRAERANGFVKQPAALNAGDAYARLNSMLDAQVSHA